MSEGVWARFLTGAMDLLHGRLAEVSPGQGPIHEGHFQDGAWVNWNAAALARPAAFLLPRTEAALCEAVRAHPRLRVVGAGHSFNEAPCSDDIMVSLDGYDRILAVDSAARTVRVQAGVRLRALTAQLAQRGLALPCLGSTDAQSLAGVLSTDLHGTGRDHGFLSEQVRSLRLVDAAGQAQTYPSESAVCQAALGGLGLLGVISEVELRCEPAYRLAKEIRILPRDGWAGALPGLLAAYDHVSLYLLGGTRRAPVRANLWRRTTEPLSGERSAWQSRVELLELFYSGFLMSSSAHLGLVEENGRLGQWLFQQLTDKVVTVFPWQQAFPRRLYYRHNEIEYGLPLDRWQPCLDQVMALLAARAFPAVVEVRFTPGRSQALLGPGVGRPTCYIELSASLAERTEAIFAECEVLLRAHGGQPHLGKALGLSAADMAAVFGERFQRFQALRQAQDPGGKFMNPFCARLFAAP